MASKFKKTSERRRATVVGARQTAPAVSARLDDNERPVVLVVDDDEDARIIYSTYLRAMGCEVFTADDGRPAVEKATDLLPDIIVMDLAMPRVNGWDAIRRLHESSWTSLIPIIAVSAVQVSRQTAFEAGCDAYLTKPCEPQVLWSQIRALLKLPARASLS